MSPSASTPSPTPAPDVSAGTKRPRTGAHVVGGWKRGLAVFAGLVMRVWCASLRLRVDQESRRLIDSPRPTLFVLWHNRLFAAAELSRRLRPARPLHGLVSASKDGAWLTAFFESAGLRVVRGSSSKGGREAAAALVEVLREGHDAGITPDGARGPLYVWKPGAGVVARRAGARALLLGIRYESAWRLRSWDRFLLPRPFSSVTVQAREIDRASLDTADARERFEAILRELNPEAGEGRPPAPGVL